MIEIKTLTGVSFETLYQTFLEAFSDYAVSVNYMDALKLKNRALKNGYDPGLSAGAFFRGKLVGFTLVGIDQTYIKPAAFDIMTGIIKEYRGQRIAGKMFGSIKASLLKAGVKQFYLEVLQENENAVRAYQKEGFKIVRNFNCYELNTRDFIPVMKLHIPLQFKNTEAHLTGCYETFADWQPSWENSFSSIRRAPDELMIISASYSINKVGLIVYYPALNWIMNLLVDPVYRNMGVGTALIQTLLTQLNHETKSLRFLNIPDDDYTLNEFLQKSGFLLFTKQYEMRLDLK